MKIAVIGANGQLGTELVAVGDDRGHEIIGFTHQQVQVETRAGVEAVERSRADAVVNTAFRPDMQANPETAADVWDVNVAMPLVDCCQRMGARYIYISTDYVFDGREGDYTENDPCRPLSLYGSTKRAGELAAMNLVADAMICRVSYLFGAVGCRAKGGGNFVDFIVQALRQGRQVDLNADTRISPTYAVDAAKSIVRLAENQADAGIYHCANSGSCSHYELGVAVAEILGCEYAFRPRYDEPMPLRPRLSNLIASRHPRLRHWRDAVERYLLKKTDIYMEM